MFKYLKSDFNKIALFIFLLISVHFNLLPHGISSEIINGGIGIKALYADLSPFSFAETKIFSPEKKQIPFQTGLTDRNGVFIFVPDAIGIWKIVISDGMGHGVVKELTINDIKNFNKENFKPLSRWYKILIGLAVIFGITGIISYFHAKKLLKGVKKDAHS